MSDKNNHRLEQEKKSLQNKLLEQLEVNSSESSETDKHGMEQEQRMEISKLKREIFNLKDELHSKEISVGNLAEQLKAAESSLENTRKEQTKVMESQRKIS